MVGVPDVGLNGKTPLGSVGGGGFTANEGADGD